MSARSRARPIRIEWRWPEGDWAVVEVCESRWSDQQLYRWEYRAPERGTGSAGSQPVEYSKALARVMQERQSSRQIDRRRAPLDNLWAQFLR